MKKWFIILLLLSTGWTSLQAVEKSARPAIFILDTFVGQDSHGENVSKTARQACLDHCEIHNVALGSAVKRENYLSALEDILQWSKKHPETRVIVNISFGSYQPDVREKNIVQKMVDRGIILVAAVGNDNTDQPMYPAGYDGVIAVAALNRYEKERYSNYGSYVDIGTQGFLRSDLVTREDNVQGAYHSENTAWLIRGGTSFASPRVSGFIGYVLSRRPDLPSGELLQLIKKTASPVKDDYLFTLKKNRSWPPE